MDALGSDVQSRIVPLELEDYGDIGCIAVIMAVDLVHVDEVDQESA